MGLLDRLRHELIDIIEWVDDSRHTLAWRFPRYRNEIKNGAQLIVRESQHAQFVYLGRFGDTFGPGRHRLTTANIPALTRLTSWRYGLESPFKADVYFLNTRLFTGNKWGTTNPVMMRDDDLGVVRARAFGTYDFRIVRPAIFLREVAGSDHDFTLDEFLDTMRARVVGAFSDSLAAARIPVLDVAGRYRELGVALLPLINPSLTERYGLEVSDFVVENVSVPPDVEQALDRRSSMAAIGSLDEYVKFQMAQGLERGGGPAGAAAELALGLSIAQEIVRAQRSGAAPASRPELLSPADVAAVLGVPEHDVLAAIDAGDLPARAIGRSTRIRRADLETFLDGGSHRR